jgi:hypothetical protein
MEPAAQEASSYFVWHVPGKPVAVHLHLDVVDRLGAEVMRGFGAVPKRGAEVGGILVGSIEPGEVTIVRVEDFEAVPCSYRRGPSYLFSEEDRVALEEALSRWQGDPFGTSTAVGYFRSHTREGLRLAEEDLELLNRYFRDPAQVALLVKPFATKVSVAGFFAREGGAFPAETPLEFPFRRREITGEAPPPRRSLMERMERRRRSEPLLEGEPRDLPAPVYPSEDPAPPQVRRPFFEFTPLALLLLLAGLIAGFGAALQFAPLLPARSAVQQYRLGLSVTRTGENLTLHWNPETNALRYAQRGLLEIEDGSFSKPVDLDAAHLRDGSVIYQNTSKLVRFRLSAYLDQRLMVTETIEWRE